MKYFHLNGEKVTLDGQADLHDDMPLLWYVRDVAAKTGTKFGCGAGLCGACTVHLNGVAVRACQITLDALEDGAHVTTIEGMQENPLYQKLKQAWMAHNVPQCGYCQVGQLMQAFALLSDNPNPSEQDIEDVMWGNICRCGTYQRIKAAIASVATGYAAPVEHQEGEGE